MDTEYKEYLPTKRHIVILISVETLFVGTFAAFHNVQSNFSKIIGIIGIILGFTLIGKYIATSSCRPIIRVYKDRVEFLGQDPWTLKPNDVKSITRVTFGRCPLIGISFQHPEQLIVKILKAQPIQILKPSVLSSLNIYIMLRIKRDPISWEKLRSLNIKDKSEWVLHIWKYNERKIGSHTCLPEPYYSKFHMDQSQQKADELFYDLERVLGKKK